MAKAPYVALNVRAERAGSRVGSHDIVREVARSVTSGQLRAGMRLPPVRALEHQFGISKNTAQAAYDELVARGLLETRIREGVFVATRPEVLDIEPVREPSPPRLAPIRMPAPQPIRRDRIELSTVFIQPEILPKQQLEDCIRSVLSAPGLRPFYDPHGLPALRETIAARLRARGMDVDADDVIMTTGSQQALDIVARSLQDRNVATENPVYSYARRLFENLGCRPFGLPLDPFGSIDLERWETLIAERKPSLLYVITSYQNPTGYSYSTPELEKLLELSERYGFALLEDDWGSDMLSGTEYRPTLRALGGRNVLYVNSFTKKLWPALRLGYLVAPPETRDTLVAAKRISTLGNAGLTEAALNEFIDRGYYDTHLSRLHQELDNRYRLCLESLWELLPPVVRFSQPGGGPTLWLDLPRTVNLNRLSDSLQQQGISISTAADHFYDDAHLHGFRVGFAFFEPVALRGALAVLGTTLRERFGLTDDVHPHAR